MKRDKRFPKTERERRKTRQEVRQIKKALIDFANTRWGKEWIHSLLKIGRPFRMRRGINYAEDEERINNLTLHKGEIFGLVQGTAPTPYRVRINFNLIPDVIWDEILDTFSSKLINLANLLEGRLPEELIDLFQEQKISLYPDASSGLNAKCSCPDQAIPCKHIAAVILYVARVIDYNPFILLELRGKNRGELIQSFGLSMQVDQQKEEQPRKKESTSPKDSNLSNIPTIGRDEILSTFGEITEEKIAIDFNFRKPRAGSNFIQNFGLPENLEYEKEFQVVLTRIYNTVRRNIYKKAVLSEKKEKK
jgi:uncharacterized Zn finger protein